MKLETLPQCSKSLCSIQVYSKHLNIKANHYLNSNLLYHKSCVINKTITINQIFGHSNTNKDGCMNHNNNSPDINLYTDLSMDMRTNIGQVTISQPLVRSLLFNNTRKNSRNLINCTRMKKSSVGLGTTSRLNWVSSMMSANLLACLQMHTLRVPLLFSQIRHRPISMLTVTLLCHLMIFAKRYDYSFRRQSENVSISSNGRPSALLIQLWPIWLYQQLSVFAKYALRLSRSNYCPLNCPLNLRENSIRACREHPALAAGLTKPKLKTSNMVNSVWNSIINYKVVHKATSTENYIQSENDWEKDEIFFTDYQYRWDGSIRGQYKGAAYTPRSGPNINRTFSSRPLSRSFQRNEKCFVCEKISFWSTNHT